MAELDMNNRDPNDINAHVKVQSEDVLAEPEGVRSLQGFAGNERDVHATDESLRDQLSRHEDECCLTPCCESCGAFFSRIQVKQ